MSPARTPARGLFVVTILTGSFLLFMVQPLVARMALPRLGGAPNVWNSAMLVYQALLLAGYGYAHRLARLPLRRQARLHLALLVLAALTLPITLVALPQPAPGAEVWWVPLLLVLSIGPVFLLVSAQAPLMQRWFALADDSAEPWALYAASNVGSFAGLLAYPLLVEPLFALRQQAWLWSAGYAVLIVLIAAAAASRWQAGSGAAPAPASVPQAACSPTPARRRLGQWLILSAVPSGLLLSTTTHLTTDIFAMPLLWVIPLALYLLSFVIAFADRRGPARAVTLLAPVVALLAGGLAMSSRGNAGLGIALASVVLLFVVCVALHARLYDLRPQADQLTLFYLVMSAGGALGGLFTALIAPVVFDWVWEHPLLVLAAAALLPVSPVWDWRRLPGLAPDMARLALGMLCAFVLFLGWLLYSAFTAGDAPATRWLLVAGLALCGLALLPWRPAYLLTLLVLMLGQGGVETVQTSLDGLRTRSYFGVYTVRDYPAERLRTLTHGTTLHGQQSRDQQFRKVPLTYYGPGSGAGLVLGHVRELYGPAPRVAVVGLGTGSLACYNQRGAAWRFYEIDPAVIAFSRDRTFTYLTDCAPQAQVVTGDARIELDRARAGSFDVLAIDAFSSDAIPLHLLTSEAFDIYLRALDPRGVLLIHISNRYIELEPALAALARDHGLHAAVRDDNPGQGAFTSSSWVALVRDPGRLRAIEAASGALTWQPLKPADPQAWSDDHASFLRYVRWNNVLKPH